MISLDRNSVSFQSFKEEFIRKFNINIADGSNLRFKLTDHKGTPIPISDFVGIVKTFHKSDFSLVVEYESTTQSRDVKIITPLMLESYFWAKNAEKLLVKDSKLSFNQRTSIVNTIVDYMIETFGVEVSSVQKILVAAATIVLFPGLKFALGDGTELLLGEFGWFTKRLNYVRTCRKNIQAQSRTVNDDLNDIQDSMQNIMVDPQRDYESLRMEPIDLNNRDMLIRKLNSTRELRKVLLNARETDLREQFPFFLVKPQMLLWDYEEHFKEDAHDTFLKDWPKYGCALRSYCNSVYETEKHTQWPAQIESILLLLKVLPPPKPRGRGKVKPYLQLLDKMIVFDVAGTAPAAMLRKDNDHPYIIAYGLSMEEILTYYVEIEKHLFP
ncbi:uncharacterized protein LOC129572737, partial [Sitodiplosis mosellana]|uniref:uncharacterized protein LOC129572737 n=1 Tax=Sitodiplosis mosellana TaxID=263140 RepID=UPI00244397F6